METLSMQNQERMQHLVEPYGPLMPIESLVVSVNKIYHAAEAQSFDESHPEHTEQLPPYWQQMTAFATSLRPGAASSILDFGCGTGFEAEQILRNLPPGSVERLTCYDPSPEMLARCRSRISPLFPQARFVSDRLAVDTGGAAYTLLATNGVLHHLPDPLAAIHDLLSLLADNALWLCGHEPSSRFYRNQECRTSYAAFLRERKWRKYLAPEKYAARIKNMLGLTSIPSKQTAEEAFRRGLFSRKPPPSVIQELTDYHVPGSLDDVLAGKGFDFEAMERELRADWKLEWVRTYSYMGRFYQGTLPAKWVRVCEHLSSAHPKDGAYFCTIWSRTRE